MILFLITIATLMSQSTFFNVRLCLAALSLLSALTYVLLRLASKSAFFARLVDKLLKSVGILSAFAVVVLVLPQVQTFLTDSTVDSNSIVQTQDFPTASEALKPSLEPSELEKASSTHETEEAPKNLVAKVESVATGEDSGHSDNGVASTSYETKAKPRSNSAETASALDREATTNSVSSLIDFANAVDSVASAQEETLGADGRDVPAGSVNATENETLDQNTRNVFDKIAKELDRRVVKVETPDKSQIRNPLAKTTGSLTPFPSPHGVVFVTCRHVIGAARQSSEIIAFFPNTQGLNPTRIYEDKAEDLAVLKFDCPEWNYVPQLRDVFAEPLMVREPFAGIGCRLNMPPTYFESIIAGERSRDDLVNLFYQEAALNPDLHLYQINEHVEKGDSGGPTFDKCDRLTGIIKAKVEDVKTGFITPIDRVAKVVADADREWYGSEQTTSEQTTKTF